MADLHQMLYHKDRVDAAALHSLKQKSPPVVSCGLFVMMEVGGIEPEKAASRRPSANDTEPLQNPANSLHSNALQNAIPIAQKQNLVDSAQNRNTSEREKCALCVHQNQGSFPPDLAVVVEAWNLLPEEIKSGIAAMVQAVRKKSGTGK